MCALKAGELFDGEAGKEKNEGKQYRRNQTP